MNNTYKEQLLKINTSSLHLAIESAKAALDTATNIKGEIIHPGAFLVFAKMIDEISDVTEDIRILCSRVDEEAMKPENEEEPK